MIRKLLATLALIVALALPAKGQTSVAVNSFNNFAELSNTGTITLTRDTNAVAYVVGDALCQRDRQFLKWDIASDKGRPVHFTQFTITTDSARVAKDSLFLWILDDTVSVTQPQDTTAYVIGAAFATHVIGKVVIELAAAPNSSSYMFGTAECDITVLPQTTKKTVYGLITTGKAFTPKRGGVYKIKHTADL